MRTTALEVASGRRRRTYSAAFKSELVSHCLQLGVSSAAVAVSHGMNPNVLRRWIKESAHAQNVEPKMKGGSVAGNATPAFVALPLNRVSREPSASNTSVPIEVQRNGITVRVTWPASNLAESAAWVRELLR